MADMSKLTERLHKQMDDPSFKPYLAIIDKLVSHKVTKLTQ